VNDRVSQIQTQDQNQFTSLSDKHQTDFLRIDESITTTDNKAQQAITSATQANAYAAQASANAAQASANAAQASASAAQANASAVQTNARALPPAAPPVEIAQAQPSPVPSPQIKELPKTASGLPLMASCGAALVLAGVLLRRKTT